MKKKNFKTLKEASDYGQGIKKNLFLRGWTIHWARVHNKPDSGAAADCAPEEQYRRATICLYPSFFEQTLEEQKEIIVHELCHIITGIQNGLLCKSHDGIFVTPSERAAAFERETSWMSDIVCGFLFK